MKITYDRSVDAATIYLVPSIAPGGVKKTYPCDPIETGALINLGFDASGRLLNIEVLEASQKLPPALLKQAQIIG